MTVPFIILDSGASLFIDGEDHLIPRDHINYDKIISALRNEDSVDVIKPLLNAGETIIEAIEDKSEIDLVDGVLHYNGSPLELFLANRIVEFYRRELPIAAMLNHLRRTMQNPSYRSREQLYQFLEHHQMPLLPDGRFIAWKSTRADGFDVHSGKNHHEVGKVFRMDRSQVDDDPTRTCSSGLHVCAKEYGMFGQKLWTVAVCPSHVVSVPVDYNGKMRVCEYEVLEFVRDFNHFEEDGGYYDFDIEVDIS